MEPEKRKSIRLKKALDLQYLSEGEGEHQVWVAGLLRDISETGLNFSSDKSFSVHEVIRLRIRFPFNPFQWIELKGRCVGIKGLSIGIYFIRLEFEDLQKEQKKAIREYFAWALNKN
ncbi:MAG: PilZ domain-containing protein [Candidatus Omnitrophota bacterium]